MAADNNWSASNSRPRVTTITITIAITAAAMIIISGDFVVSTCEGSEARSMAQHASVWPFRGSANDLAALLTQHQPLRPIELDQNLRHTIEPLARPGSSRRSAGNRSQTATGTIHLITYD